MTFRNWFQSGLQVSQTLSLPVKMRINFDHCFLLCYHLVQDVHTVFLSQPYFLIGSLVLDVKRVFSAAIFVRKKLVPVLHHFVVGVVTPLVGGLA